MCRWLALVGVLAVTMPRAATSAQQKVGESPASSQATLALGAGKTQASPADDLARLENIEDSIRQRKYQEAVPLLQAYLKDFPKSSRAYYDLGYATFRTHDFRTSITSLSRSLSLNSHNPEAHKILGLDCSFVGRYDLAEQELREAIRQEPSSAEIHYFLGRLFYTRGVYPLAKEEFEKALHLDDQYMKAWDNLGLTMEALGDDTRALQCYKTAMDLNEKQKQRSEWPYVNVSAFYNRQVQPDLAIAYAQKAIGFNPRSAPANVQLARAYRVLGDWQKCVEAAQQAVDLNPWTSDAYYIMGIALRKLGKIEESRAAMAKFEQIHQEEQIDLPQKLGIASRIKGDHPRPLNPDEEPSR
jgi:tetratricopeptide (TPR) repeat protein